METETETQGASGLDKARVGQCYQLAGEYAIEDTARILVHGTIQHDPYPDNPHAWVEFEGNDTWEDAWLVWEPVSQDILPRPVFYALFNACEHHRYDSNTQFGWMEKTRNWGPWEGEYWQLDGAKKVKGKEG